MDCSPLKTLPFELRMNIWEMVLNSEDGLNVALDKPKEYKSKKAMLTIHPLAIRATCAEIHEETRGVVFAVNDSWRFEIPKDRKLSKWSERLSRWHAQAGEKCLKAARAVEIDLGDWAIVGQMRPSTIPIACGESTGTAISEMWQLLPKPLRRTEIATTITLHLHWTSGIELDDDGGCQPFPAFTISTQMWTPRLTILRQHKRAMENYGSYARMFFRRFRDSWRDGCGPVPPFTRPPNYNVEGPRIYRELNLLEYTAKDVVYDIGALFSDESHVARCKIGEGSIWMQKLAMQNKGQ
ncbi:hypothetical protein Q7P37_002025 [Cladosporium fusiforme]